MSRLCLALLYIFFLCRRYADAQVCAVAHSIQFKPAYYPGIRSYITSESVELVVRKNVPLPVVIVQILDSTGKLYPQTKPIEINIGIIPPNATVFESQTAQIVSGEAVLSQLSFKALPSSPTIVVFTANVLGADQTDRVNNVSIRTGPVRVDDRVPVPTTLRFGPDGSHFVFDAGQSPKQYLGGIYQSQELFVPLRQPLPVIKVHVLDQFNQIIFGSLTNIEVRSTNTSECQVTASSAVGNGTITIMELTLTEIAQGNCDGKAIIFFSRQRPDLNISTLPLKVIKAPTPNSVLRFDTVVARSIVNSINQSPIPVAVVGVSIPPIRINILNSHYAPDMSSSGLIITAFATKGTIKGNKVLVQDGVAVFNELTFLDNPRSSELLFVAGQQGRLPVASMMIFSGTIRVENTAVRNAFISFAANSWIDVETPRRWARDKVFPRIIIRMLDSTHFYDSSANNLNVTATCSNCILGGDITSMNSGIAIFNNLNVISGTPTAPTIQLTFQILNANVPVSLERRTIVTDIITLDAVVTSSWERSTLRFGGPEVSLLWRVDQPLFATEDTALPEIVVDVISSTGQLTLPDKSVGMIAYSGDSPQGSLLESPKVYSTDGRFRFNCMRFKKTPQTLERITFQVESVSTSKLKPIKSGFVTVTDLPKPSYAIRFRKYTSLVTYEGQSLSAVQNIAIPPIEIEMIQSSYQIDETNNKAVVVATASSGVLHPDGVVATMERGIARFLLLKFTSKARDAVITFTVLQDNVDAQGKQIQTGIVILTLLPIPALWLSFVDSGNTKIKQPRQEFTLDTFSSTIDNVTLGLKDSSYQFSIQSRSSGDNSLVMSVFGPEGTTLEAYCAGHPATVVTADGQFISSGAAPVSGPPTATTNMLVCPAESNGLFRFEKVRFTSNNPPPNIFLTFKAYSYSGKSIVDGQELVAGPIVLTTRTRTETCTSTNEQPIVIAELKRSPERVIQTELSLKQQIAFLMGVEVERVIFPKLLSTKAIQGVDITTGEAWRGSKVEVMFAPPTLTSTNKKSSVKLADDFRKIRPGPLSEAMDLREVYLQSEDKSCEVEKFYAAKNAADEKCERGCGTKCGDNDKCLCWSENPVITLHGKRCQSLAETSVNEEAKQLLSVMIQMCKSLVYCKDDNAIRDVCLDLYKAEVTTIWTFVIGPIVFCAACLIGWIIYRRVKRYQFRMKPSAHDNFRQANERLKPIHAFFKAN